MSRLIDADSLALFPNNPESGTDDMINSWIEECGLSNLKLYITEDCPVDIEHALTELCWKVIQGYINVIETEPTAYNMDKVLEQLKVLSEKHFKRYCECMEQKDKEMALKHSLKFCSYDDAIDIVKGGGVE